MNPWMVLVYFLFAVLSGAAAGWSASSWRTRPLPPLPDEDRLRVALRGLSYDEMIQLLMMWRRRARRLDDAGPVRC